MKTLIGLPAYNESPCIGKLLDRINDVRDEFKLPLEVIVINDGSTDDTEEYLKQYSNDYSYISYIDHDGNKGLAQGMRTIIDYALSHLEDEDVLVVMDADNTHNPNIIPTMINKLKKNHLDIVIASRFKYGGEEKGLKLKRRILSKGASIFANIFFGVKNVKDYSCGYRAYDIEFLRKLKDFYKDKLIEAKGFECMIELIIKAGKSGGRIEESPLVLEYNLKESPSKMKVVKTINGYLKLGVKYNRLRKVK
ncbi:glycosyltransferase family 2 protein [Tissierella sp. Yu-01]|uniref:glycosyltransferase family 2 protein n=1 Tax=Tissierella sp. Yu-01 TaxID=3035694 RepID=UPI00240D60FD|nr:glycosyltransferase family 2 protein [Tissierella sp. Yu-01]WFA08570.1 glycosyltransferase family 2 protein [Tissierella sp. Yu-01]